MAGISLDADESAFLKDLLRAIDAVPGSWSWIAGKLRWEGRPDPEASLDALAKKLDPPPEDAATHG